MMLAIEPDSVHLERGEAGYMGPLAPVFDQINRDGMESVTPNGVLGDPAKSTAAHGQAYLARVTDLLVDHVRAGIRLADRTPLGRRDHLQSEDAQDVFAADGGLGCLVEVGEANAGQIRRPDPCTGHSNQTRPVRASSATVSSMKSSR